MDVTARLKSLLALAQHPSTPIDEARTAAYALLKTCRDNGVGLSFKLPKKEPAKPSAPPPPDVPRPGRGQWPAEWSAEWSAKRSAEWSAESEERLRREAQRRRANPFGGAARSPFSPFPSPEVVNASDFISFFNEVMNHEAARRRTSTPNYADPAPDFTPDGSTCPICRGPMMANMLGANICLSCARKQAAGARAPEAKVCSRCERVNLADAKICTRCRMFF